MAQQVCVLLSGEEREQLATNAADRNWPRKHVERARIVLASANRHSAQEVARSIGVSRPTVWRWQQRSAEAGLKVCCATGHLGPASRRLSQKRGRGWWR